VDRTTTERLIALLHAQRGEVARRAGEQRGSDGWTEASDRLEALNQQIMRFGLTVGATPAGDLRPDDEEGARPRD
jgi:hypothetical protein